MSKETSSRHGVYYRFVLSRLLYIDIREYEDYESLLRKELTITAAISNVNSVNDSIKAQYLKHVSTF